MKVTYNWLKDFVKINLSAEALADKLTMAGLEVTALEKKEGDFVFEIEVTSNRPDCLSVLGIAREVAAITNSKMRAYSVERIAYSKNLSAKRYPLNAQTLTISIEDKNDCPFYTARIIRSLKVGPSPEWMRRRLELVGCRSVNNVVDTTNYVLFELGEPLHGFDLDKLAQGQAAIFVRRAKMGEKITAINGEEKSLDADMLVVADSRGPVAVAGIMGGKDTEVTEDTTNILLEAAVFNPITVRRARQRLGMESESAYRFERGVDQGIVEAASLRAAQLLADLAGAECLLAKTCGRPDLKRHKITLNIPQSNKILGTNISANAAKKILLGLGFKVKAPGKNNIAVEAPSFRSDIRAQIDLTEELARIHGFDKIPASLPWLRAESIPDKDRGLVSAVKNILTGLGLNEVITYSLVDKTALQKEGLRVLNPLSREQEFLRPQLAASLAACVKGNLNYKQDYVNIFEVAKVFSPGADGAKEELTLAIALCGTKHYLCGQGAIKEKFGLLHLKGVLEALMERMAAADCAFTPQGASLVGIYAGADKLGEMQVLGEMVAAELSLEKMFLHLKPVKVFQPLPKYPEILRDISLLLKEAAPVAQVLEAAKDAGRPLLRQVKVTDYYKGSQIPEGNIGLTISCIYRSDERTLTEAEVSPVHQRICAALTEGFGAKFR